jgi:hypothetical protein
MENAVAEGDADSGPVEEGGTNAGRTQEEPDEGEESHAHHR